MTRAPRISRAPVEAPDESDRFEDAPHPREVYQLFGHEAAEKILLDAYRENRLAQSWIIGGREGIGKATLAWRFARFLFAHPDPQSLAVQTAENLYVDPQAPAARRVATLAHGDLALLRREWNSDGKRHYQEIRIDDARHVMTRFQQAAAEGGWRIAIVDCAEDLSRSTANALLKLIEEPPPKSLFLFVAHRPGQLLATIRSRSRLLPVSPLSEADVIKAIGALGDRWWEMEAAELRAAAARCGGSVRDALRYLGGDSLKLIGQIDQLLARLPDVDWKGVQALADNFIRRDNTADFEAAIAAIFDWIDGHVRDRAARGAGEGKALGPGSPGKLAPYAEVWEKFARSVRETETFNLDRRAVILSIFSDLAAAARRAA